jgi:peptidoglycan/xylan/chitin deacetylase (PgdA/CDA1 family)
MRAILTYHSIDASGSPISCAPEVFDRHLTWLTSGRVRVAALDELVALPPDTDAVALTFDDGFVNFRDYAAPRLRDHGLPATLFVVAGLAGRTNAWDARPGRRTPDLPLLDWPDLVRLQESGVTLGAHSLTHPDLTVLEPGRLADEVEGSAALIDERTGRRPPAFAYPYGHWHAASAQLVARSYQWACTTDFLALDVGAPAWALPRLDMWYFQHPNSLDAWGTGRFRARVLLRHGLRRTRRMAASRTRPR